MQSIVSTLGFLTVLLPSVLAVYLQSYYPFISYHNPFGVVHPPVQSHGYYNPVHGGSASQFQSRHGHGHGPVHGHGHPGTSPVEVITIPIAVLKRLLLAEIKEDKPVVLAFDGKNYTLPYMETMKLMNVTSSLLAEPKVESERLVLEIDTQSSTLAPNVTDTFGQRLIISPEPISSYKNGVEGSA
ncbi:unnamed protein product [Allacma fusca]|uniref:Uncharacterized protein n=1 Tax=Allacma fusca TaxID=39272 RepID=A0A8J2J4M7_9HEXA|nr:unnamed protein product [Allacma fusca]